MWREGRGQTWKVKSEKVRIEHRDVRGQKHMHIHTLRSKRIGN
jgi:hypothetical protein